ncbi:MAG: HAD family hydrolase [Clostridiales bacterium]|nr:HAD family hydrolase [Clostridiales bacterium]
MRADQILLDMSKENDYFVGIDSDGCAFDSMEIKHKECFCPNTINYWDLQPISKYAREAAEFVNLYSKNRGVNRFPALIEVIDLLTVREECIERGYKPPNLDELREWVVTETKLGNPALIKRVDEKPTPLMKKALEWSLAVNETVTKIVRNVPPFPYFRESLEKMNSECDIVCVSATPNEALNREWVEHDIAKYAKVIAGQEIGTKKESLVTCALKGYDSDKMLMIGDAPGDLRAAREAGCLFYPINPGDEENSWKRFVNEAYDKFINNTYKGKYEKALIAEFDTYLPSTPPWNK